MNSWRFVLLVLGALLLLNTTEVHAQENWRLGVDVTPSYFMMYNQRDWNNGFFYPNKQAIFDIKGFVGGVRISCDLNEYLSIYSGLRYAYSRQDYKQFSQEKVYSFYENYHQSSELQIPVLLSFGTSNQDDLRIYGSIGVGLNYRLNYTEHLGWINKSDQPNWSNEETYHGTTYSVYSTYNGIFSEEINVDKMYKDFMLMGLAEVGITRTFNSGWGINIALHAQVGLTNPENRDAQFYDIPEGSTPRYLWNTADGTKWWPNQVEEDVRPQTFPMHFGVLFGVYYQFGYY
jgi:hypothetical protein